MDRLALIAGARARLRTWTPRLWLVLQTTAAGTTAWVVARELGDNPTPIFASVAAVVVVNACAANARSTRCGCCWESSSGS